MDNGAHKQSWTDREKKHSFEYWRDLYKIPDIQCKKWTRLFENILFTDFGFVRI